MRRQPCHRKKYTEPGRSHSHYRVGIEGYSAHPTGRVFIFERGDPRRDILIPTEAPRQLDQDRTGMLLDNGSARGTLSRSSSRNAAGIRVLAPGGNHHGGHLIPIDARSRGAAEVPSSRTLGPRRPSSPTSAWCSHARHTTTSERSSSLRWIIPPEIGCPVDGRFPVHDETIEKDRAEGRPEGLRRRHPMQSSTTSGTTGDPKGGRFRNIRTGVYNIPQPARLKYKRTDVLTTTVSHPRQRQPSRCSPRCTQDQACSFTVHKCLIWDICRKYGCSVLPAGGMMCASTTNRKGPTMPTTLWRSS